jgi:putative endonuclease
VLYTGITNSLQSRLWFHKTTSERSFTKRYKINRLVYYETFEDPNDAIAREKEIKAWRREKKNELVEMLNPKWDDLRSQLFDVPQRVIPSGARNLTVEGPITQGI